MPSVTIQVRGDTITEGGSVPVVSANVPIKAHREAAGLTQEDVASQLRELALLHRQQRVGATADMVSKWERGLKRPSKLYRELLALLYGVNVAELVTSSPQPAPALVLVPGPIAPTLEAVDRREFLQSAVAVSALGALAAGSVSDPPLASLREALITYAAVPVADRSGDQGPPNLARLKRGTLQAWHTFQESRYTQLARLLPALLANGRAATRQLDGDAALTAAGYLSQTYQLTAIMLLKLGDSNFAWVAADRAMQTAEQSQNRFTIASAARILGYALMGGNHHRHAKQLTVSAANVLEPGLRTASQAHLSLYGALLLKGAMAAAFEGDATLSRALLAEADTTARRMRGDANHWWTAFGPSNVAVHRVSAAVELGDGPRALNATDTAVLAQLPVLERRSAYLLDVSRALHLVNRPRQALDTVLRAEQLAPEEIRYQPTARVLIGHLLQAPITRGRPETRALAHRIGLPT